MLQKNKLYQCCHHYHLLPLDSLNPSKPTATLYINRFNIHKFYVLPTQCIYVFCVDLRTNSDYFTVQRYLSGFYKRYGTCLLRGTSYVLK
jgi:hypothetical protein